MDPTHVNMLILYNGWANRRVMKAAVVCPREACNRSIGGSFSSIGETLAHMYWAEWLWYRRLRGESTDHAPSSQDFAELDELFQVWSELTDQWIEWSEELTDEAVHQPIRYRNLHGVEDVQPVWQIVSHVVNHASYHRGQVATMMRQVGEKPVGTDMIQYFRENVVGPMFDFGPN